MKYKIITSQVFIDRDLLEGINMASVAKKVGVTRQYLYALKDGTYVATYKMYLRIKKVVNKGLDKIK
jgi:hypothetical protein